MKTQTIEKVETTVEETKHCRYCHQDKPIKQFVQGKKCCRSCNNKRINEHKERKAESLFNGYFDNQPFAWAW